MDETSVWPAQASRRATRAIVDLDALAGNIEIIRRSLSSDVALMAVVKANGYGHGAIMTAQVAAAAGASRLGVATVGEGTALRRAGTDLPILVLGPVHADEIEQALAAQLQLMVGDAVMVRQIASEARRLALAEPAAVHLEIDTGMRRHGALPEEASDLARAISDEPALSLDGVATHFAVADDTESEFTEEQAARFECCLREIQSLGIRLGVIHAANSAGTLNFPRHHRDMVRVGIAMYGLPPSSCLPLPTGVRPVMTVASRVARVMTLATGDTVSYGRTYTATLPERAVLVPIGYADGYRRGWSSRAWMAIEGYRAPVRGRVCMDQTVIGLPAGAIVRTGDEVIVAGGQNNDAPSFDELGGLIDTISYEVATGFSTRVPRIFRRHGRTVAIEDATGLHRITPDAVSAR